MKTDKIVNKFNKLIDNHLKYINEIELLGESLQPFIPFDFTIFHQPSDGFVILNVETMQNSLLKSCIDSIMENGKLTIEEYNSYSI